MNDGTQKYKKENYFNHKKSTYTCLNIKEHHYCENKK